MRATVTAITAALAAAVIVPFAAGATKPTDPRICSFHSAKQCSKSAAVTALKIAMSKRLNVGWSADITCAGHANFLRFTCTYKTATTGGHALIVFAPDTWKATVTAS